MILDKTENNIAQVMGAGGVSHPAVRPSIRGVQFGAGQRGLVGRCHRLFVFHIAKNLEAMGW